MCVCVCVCVCVLADTCMYEREGRERKRESWGWVHCDVMNPTCTIIKILHLACQYAYLKTSNCADVRGNPNPSFESQLAQHCLILEELHGLFTFVSSNSSIEEYLDFNNKSDRFTCASFYLKRNLFNWEQKPFSHGLTFLLNLALQIALCRCSWW